MLLLLTATLGNLYMLCVAVQWENRCRETDEIKIDERREKE